MKTKIAIMLTILAGTLFAGTPSALADRNPRVVREAERREAIRQDTTWTPENIRANPYLFLQDAIRSCDLLKEKIEAQQISFLRLKKTADRKVAEADSTIRRYTKFLEDAKIAFKNAQATGTWPVEINGFELTEDELDEKVADALERVDLAKKSKKTSLLISKKVTIRQGVLKTKSRELISVRRKLVLQAEQVKMNEQLNEINELTDILAVIKDMSLELAEEPTKFTLDDITEEDPDATRKLSSREFLES